MDTSETYIKMCDCEEIQEIYHKDLTVRYTPSNAGYLIDSKYDYLYRHKLGGTPIWLPRQDQLQEMVRDKFQRQYLMVVDFTKLCVDDMPDDMSMEQLWLAFVMKEKYSKTWDGKEWVSV